MMMVVGSSSMARASEEQGGYGHFMQFPVHPAGPRKSVRRKADLRRTGSEGGPAPATTRNEDKTMNVETPVKATARDGKGRAPKPLPAPNSDFYEFAETLPAEELAIVKKVRAYMETKVAPIINKYWVEDSF